MATEKPKLIIKKGMNRSNHVEHKLFAETADTREKYFATVVRGDGEKDRDALSDKINAAAGDKDKIKAIIKARVISITLYDDNQKAYPFGDEVFDWIYEHPAYVTPLISAMYASAADSKYKQERLGN